MICFLCLRVDWARWRSSLLIVVLTLFSRRWESTMEEEDGFLFAFFSSAMYSFCIRKWLVARQEKGWMRTFAQVVEDIFWCRASLENTSTVLKNVDSTALRELFVCNILADRKAVSGQLSVGAGVIVVSFQFLEKQSSTRVGYLPVEGRTMSSSYGLCCRYLHANQNLLRVSFKMLWTFNMHDARSNFPTRDVINRIFFDKLLDWEKGLKDVLQELWNTHIVMKRWSTEVQTSLQDTVSLRTSLICALSPGKIATQFSSLAIE